MEIKIDTEALSNNNINSNKVASSQIIEEMVNFHINEIDQYLLKQENKFLIPEYFIIKINCLLIENSEEKSLIMLAEIKESFQTLYDYKEKDKVFIFSKNIDFFNRLISFVHKSNKNNGNANHKMSNNINLKFNKNDFEKEFDTNNIFEESDSSEFSKILLNNFELKIDLEETIFIPANEFINCLSLYYNINYNKKEINYNNKNNHSEFNREYLDKLFFIMISISNIIKIYYFYYKKFKFNKWDSFLISSTFLEEAILLSILLNFLGLKAVINKFTIKNNYESLALSDIQEYSFELENLDLLLSNEKTKNLFIKKEEDEIHLNKNNNLEYFYQNYIKNSIDNKVEILNLSEQEAKIEAYQKDEFLTFDFEAKFFNYILDTSGEGLNGKNKILYFKLLQNEGNIIINDNINEQIQIDPRDISFMNSKSISICFSNIKKNLKFNINQGKVINFVLDFISKMIFISDKYIKNIFKKINFSVAFYENRDENLNIENFTNKDKFLNMFVFDI